MSVLLVSILNKKDADTYAEYSRRARIPLAEVGAEIIVSDDAPEILEEAGSGNRVVILKFKDEECYQRWWNSPEYREAVPFRHKSADTLFLAKVKGFAP